MCSSDLEIRAVCPQAVMGTGYGMTEASGSLAQAVGEDFIRNRASAGRVLPLAQVRIVAPDGTIMPTGQSGEIQLKGAMVMAGYWNRPEATAETIRPDGWHWQSPAATGRRGIGTRPVRRCLR